MDEAMKSTEGGRERRPTTRILRYAAGILLLLVLLGLFPQVRGMLVRKLAWLSLQRAVSGPSEDEYAYLARAGEGFATAARIMPGDTLALDGLGLVYLHYGATDSAIETLSHISSNAAWMEDVARMHLLIAQTRDLGAEQRGDIVGEAARDWCSDAGLRQQLAAFTGQGECESAGEWLAWIASRCELSPASDAVARIAVGSCYVEAGAALAGINYLEDATRLTPDSAPAWVALGDAWLVAGDTLRAVEAFRTALERDPGSPAARERIKQLQTP